MFKSHGVPVYRKAGTPDIPFIAGLLRQFYARAGSIYRIPFCETSTRAWIDYVMENGVCLVGPSSCAGATLFPFQMNANAMVANVDFWYFSRAREIAIFDALVDACREAGAVRLFVQSQALTPAIVRHYQGKGLQECATQFSACIA